MTNPREEQTCEKRTGPPAPGDLYAFSIPEHSPVEWLVVREHPDDRGLLFIVPADDCPLAGTPDVAVVHPEVRRPLVVRCAEGVWLRSQRFGADRRVGFLPGEVVRQVRQKVAALARGQAVGDEQQRRTDADPAYDRWLALLGQCRERLEASEGAPGP